MWLLFPLYSSDPGYIRLNLSTFTQKHRRLFLALLWCLLPWQIASASDDIQWANDLQADAAQIITNNTLMVLFVTASYCEYCELLREEVFQFLADDPRFLLRELVLDADQQPITGFDGQPTNHATYGKQQNIQLTPTVLFLGPDGEEIAERMIGVLTLDFYTYYLDEQVKSARDQLVKQSAQKAG